MVERQTAFKIRVGDLISGEFNKDEGEFGLGYVLVGGLKVSRVNLVVSVVGKDSADGFSSLSVDDGSGVIDVRCFENDLLSGFSIGEVVNIIGKVRMFGNSNYVACELISKVDDLAWVELRKLELKNNVLPEIKKVEEPQNEIVLPEKKSVVEEEIIVEEVSSVKDKETDAVSEEKAEEPKPELTPVEKVLEIIRTNDQGQGVDIEDIITESGSTDCEKIINSLLAEGDIFEVKPGRVKVLE